jgi:large subunit ribosomal protein L2
MGKRIIARRRGSGSAVYRSPSHKHKGQPRLPRIDEGTGTVVAIEHAPGRSGPIVWVDLSNGDQALQVAAEGMHIGQTIIYSAERPPIVRGNTGPIGMIPEGTPE